MYRAFAIQHGSWSGINDSLWRALGREWPELKLNHLDYEVHCLGRLSPIKKAGLAINATLQYSCRLLEAALSSPRQLRHEINDCIHLTSYAVNAGNCVIRKICDNRKNALGQIHFMLQTGSRFDGRIPGIPHFLYIDHTHLANLQYSGFSSRDLNRSSWIESERELYQDSTAIFVMSNHVRRSLIEDYDVDPKRCIMIGAGCNVSPDGYDLANRKKSKKEILFVGKQWERKGGPVLLEAFKFVLEKHPDAKLKILGCSPKVDIPNVEVLGFLPHEEVKRHFLSAGVFCMPTRREPFGIVYLEAMAFGVPIVATDLGALPDLVDNGHNGVLVPVDDPDELTRGICRVLEDDEFAFRCKVEGVRKIKEFYSWDLVAARMRAEIVARVER